MIPGALLAIAILAGTALGLATWKALAPKPLNSQILARQDLPCALALAALGLAFGAWNWVAGAAPPPWRPTLVMDDLARFLGALFLGLSGLFWLGDGAGRGSVGDRPSASQSAAQKPRPALGSPLPALGDSLPDGRERCALFLLATCGGLIAISAADLLTLWVGLVLYTFARAPLVPHSPLPILGKGAWVRDLSGLAASLLGLALLYASAGTPELIPLGRHLWEHGGPRPATLYAGASLALGGIALVAGLLPPYEPEAPRQGDASATILGAALLARLCLYPLGALSWEWSWALILAAIGALAWACAAFILRVDPLAQLHRWTMAQKGFLLLALGLAFHEQGLVALLTSLPAYGLAQVILSLSERWVQYDASDALPVDSLKGLARHNPWLGAPLFVSLLSFVGAPATLGFIGRVRLLWAAQVAELPGLVIVILLASGLYSSVYLPLALALFSKGSKEHISRSFPWPLRLATALAALGLVVLGLYPQPLIRWALRIVETGFIP